MERAHGNACQGKLWGTPKDRALFTGENRDLVAECREVVKGALGLSRKRELGSDFWPWPSPNQ